MKCALSTPIRNKLLREFAELWPPDQLWVDIVDREGQRRSAVHMIPVRRLGGMLCWEQNSSLCFMMDRDLDPAWFAYRAERNSKPLLYAAMDTPLYRHDEVQFVTIAGDLIWEIVDSPTPVWAAQTTDEQLKEFLG